MIYHQGFFMLSHQDSNLNKQNQNLLCYHYTMRQSGAFFQKRCKGTCLLLNLQHFLRKTYFAISKK